MIFSFETSDDEKKFSPELPKNCSRSIMAAEDLNAYKVNMLINLTDTHINSIVTHRFQLERRQMLHVMWLRWWFRARKWMKSRPFSWVLFIKFYMLMKIYWRKINIPFFGALFFHFIHTYTLTNSSNILHFESAQKIFLFCVLRWGRK